MPSLSLLLCTPCSGANGSSSCTTSIPVKSPRWKITSAVSSAVNTAAGSSLPRLGMCVSASTTARTSGTEEQAEDRHRVDDGMDEHRRVDAAGVVKDIGKHDADEDEDRQSVQLEVDDPEREPAEQRRCQYSPSYREPALEEAAHSLEHDSSKERFLRNRGLNTYPEHDQQLFSYPVRSRAREEIFGIAVQVVPGPEGVEEEVQQSDAQEGRQNDCRRGE